MAIVSVGTMLAAGAAPGPPNTPTIASNSSNPSTSTTPPAATPAVTPAAPCPALVCTKLKVEGTSRIAKLSSDIVLAPGLFTAKAFLEGTDPNWPLRIEGELDLPTSDAYLVVLRFMPSTNKVSFIQDGKVTGRGRIVQPPGQPIAIYVEAELVAKLFVQLTDVKQDGIPLDVGNRCRTETSATIPINATIKVEIGAKSQTEAIFGLPRFAGCGVTEDLDPLFTGLVSGPGNLLKSTLTVISIGEA